MSNAALKLAARQDYRGVGTVEFVVDADSHEFFFLEMNTRLQVEHPVTEMITGLDIVKMQLQLALGGFSEELGNTEVCPSGHAIECRIHAEEPSRGFRPSPGRIEVFRMPTESPCVRIDTGVQQGTAITAYYDPLIAKLTCHGKTRAKAREVMLRALAETRISGLMTNVDFLKDFVASPYFDADKLQTKAIELFMKDTNHRDVARNPAPARTG